MTKEELVEKDYKIIKSATEPFDTTDSSGRLMFQQLGAFAEFERSRIKERVFPGMVGSITGDAEIVNIKTS